MPDYLFSPGEFPDNPVTNRSRMFFSTPPPADTLPSRPPPVTPPACPHQHPPSVLVLGGRRRGCGEDSRPGVLGQPAVTRAAAVTTAPAAAQSHLGPGPPRRPRYPLIAYRRSGAQWQRQRGSGAALKQTVKVRREVYAARVFDRVIAADRRGEG